MALKAFASELFIYIIFLCIFYFMYVHTHTHTHTHTLPFKSLKAHQRLFFLRRLRKFGTSPRILRSFYTCTVESILTGCITAWFGNSTAGNRRASAKGRANCPPHCWRWASLPPGYLHQAVYKESPEDYQRLQPPVPQSALSVALRETSPQHPIPH